MAKTRKTAAQLVDLVTAEVMKDPAVRDDLKSDPKFKLNVGMPTWHEPDGRSNWGIRVVPKDSGHAHTIAAAVEKVRGFFDLKE